MSADWSSTPVPVPYANFGDPQTLSLYGYVRGLPTAKADIDGHGWLEKASEDYWKGRAEEKKQIDAYANKTIESHPLLKAWDQFTQKVDNGLNGHGWKTDAEAASADAASRAEWAKTSRGIPYPEMKIGIVLSAPALADEALVVRGGLNQAENFVNGTGVTVDAAGNLQGVSVNSANGASVKELSQGIKNGEVGVSTVRDVRAAGGDVKPSPTVNNPNHCTMCGITPQKAQELFTPTVKNPSKP